MPEKLGSGTEPIGRERVDTAGAGLYNLPHRPPGWTEMIAGIVLAAGMSRRMGRLKQLLPLGDRRVIQVVVEQILDHVDRLFVVLGYRSDEVAAVLAGYPIEVVLNEAYELGMTSSIRCGVAAAATADAYLLCLGDQPGVEATTVERLTWTRQESGRGLVIPCSEGRRGHPILIGAGYTAEILSMSDDTPFNSFTRGHPEDTIEVVLATARIHDDMDTQDDYEREQLHFRGRSEG